MLNIYNWADYIGYRTIAEFERKTHIKVVYQIYDSNETLEAKLLAGHSGFDIVSTTTGFYGRQIRAGAYMPLDKSKLPNLKNIDPAVLAIQAQADPGNRYAVPYLHAMNGFIYNVDVVRARMPDAPTDSLAMLFDPAVVAKFADCGVTFLDSPEDVIQLALAYLHRDPNSQTLEDLAAAERTVMAVRPYIRKFDSNDYWHQMASKEICVAIAWSSDYSVAQARAREDGTGAHLAFTLPKEGSNITYNAFLIPASAPHPEAAHRVSEFHLRSPGDRRDHQRHSLRERQSRRASLRRQGEILEGPGGLSAAGDSREAVSAGGARRRLRPRAHARLDAHQNRAVGGRPRAGDRRTGVRRGRWRPEHQKSRFFRGISLRFATWRKLSANPGNVSLRPHLRDLARDRPGVRDHKSRRSHAKNRCPLGPQRPARRHGFVDGRARRSSAVAVRCTAHGALGAARSSGGRGASRSSARMCLDFHSTQP